MFCWKKFHVLVIYVHFVFKKLGPREHLKIFLDVSLFFFFCFVFFFFVPRGKSSVSSLGCFCCFFFFLKFLVGIVFFILGVHHSRVRGSPMWCLKVFSVEVTNVGFKGLLFFFASRSTMWGLKVFRKVRG